MRIKYIIALTSVVLFWSCGGGEKTQPKEVENLEVRKATGTVNHHGKEIPIKYGGIFRMNETSSFKTLFPQAMGDVVGTHIGSQMYEGLVKLDPATLEILPCIAQSFTPNEDATVWTFKLNDNVYFHDDPCFEGGKGRRVTAQDIKYCFDRLATAYPMNNTFYVIQNKIKGVNEHYEKTSKGETVEGGVEGVKVIDENTIEFTLYESLSFFPKILVHNACWIFPKEAYEMYGEDMRSHVVGTGPFIIDAIKEGSQVRMRRNENYWRKDEFGNQLPYLDLVKVTFTRDKKSELANFRKDNLEMIATLPVDEMETVLVGLEDAMQGKNSAFEYQQSDALNVQMYDFLHTGKIFKDIRVRKAFCYAIDRKSLVDFTLRGDGTPAEHGIVPNYSNYDNTKIKGYSYEPETARALLAEAGYPNGEGFPKVSLTLNDGGGRNTRIAEAIYNMIKQNLGIHLDIDVVPFTTMLEKQSLGELEFTRRGWVADYPDASTFLEIYYGKTVPEDPHAPSMVNTSRYKNPVFDSIFELAMKTPDEKTRTKLYQECDQILIDDAATLPLFYADNVRLVKSYVIGFPINAMDYRDLSQVFLNK